MKKEIFNGAKLKVARIYRGKTVDQLAKEVNINKKDIIAFEENKYKPTPENTMKLSHNLQFPREYFFKNENIKVTVEGSHFNPQSTIPRNEEISYREKLIMTHKIYTFMQGYIKFPELNLPDNLNRNDDIEEMAIKTRRYWGLGDGAIGNMVSLLESNGVLLSGINIDRKGASPYTQKQNLNKESLYVIALGNDKKSATVRNYDLAYELAYIISNELNIPSKRFNADEFACAFLLPKDVFLEGLSNPNELDFYVEMKTKWLVPISIMIFRAYTLGAINYKKYNFLMNEMNKKGWLKKEPLDDNIKGVSPQTLKTAVELLFENNIMSKNTLMDNLANFGINMNPTDIEILIGLKEGTLASNVAIKGNQVKNNNKNNVKVVDFKNKKRR
ncbi:transcriptional regulator [Romboutsia ilealis]|uniref:Helix-turn-helix domain-containing protein n=1 Tax=Romboutsia faecis TaxID=2764597 RepID=A0ABR7JKJ1_9FIRM|nr:XRE family transcriptional regulator [Romboutsia faecis]MBC5995440.1 helix-turn-helix domain-containing protein [Romboutsia faecis]MRN24317.1 transcriptional regulator [Romboutsia ilealis]